MKTLTINLFAFFLLAALISCKENDPAPTISKSIDGVWEGKYGNGTKTPDWFWSFEIDPDGVIHELNSGGEKIGKGIWTKTATNFVSTYHNDRPYNATYSLKATYNESEGTLKGTWGYGNNETDGGTFSLSKKRAERR